MNKSSDQLIGPKGYFIIYCVVLFICGLFVSCIGPMIPFLSSYSGIPETQYSFLFVARTIGSIASCLLYKYLRKIQKSQFNQHKVLAISLGVCSLFSYLFVVWRTIFGEWMELIALGGGYYCTITAVNILLLVISTKNIGWMSFGSGIFGIGALTSPLVIRFFEIKLFYLISFLFMFTAALSLYFPTPKKSQPYEQKGDQPKFKQGTLTEQILISLGFFLIVGIQISVSGWIPSYAVLFGICNKSQATSYVTIFWTLSTICRFATAALEIRSSIKIRTLVVSIVCSSLICIFLHQVGSYGAAAMFGSIFYGISCSAVYPMLLSVSSEFGIKFKPQQTSNMMLSTVFSYGILVALAGKLMQIRIGSLFYSLLVMGVGLLLAVFYAIKMMKRQGELQNEKQTQLKQIICQ